MKFQQNILHGLLSLCLAGCASDANQTNHHSASATNRNVKKAIAIVNPTKGHQAHGKVEFVATEKGVQVIADVVGLPPGLHAFHIHEHGDCSAPDGSSAGAHFNPTGKKHGAPEDEERHHGDLGNLKADENGTVHYERLDHVITLNGDYAILGKSVVIHADPDDFKSQPAGNAGARVACGVIHAVED